MQDAGTNMAYICRQWNVPSESVGPEHCYSLSGSMGVLRNYQPYLHTNRGERRCIPTQTTAVQSNWELPIY